MQLIQRLLIANRGEIATRIASTARRLGITTVALYSQADRESLHVRSCDERYSLGPTDSYLDLDTVIQIAKDARVDAIHPGYGFLSENDLFPERAEQAGIIFVGPSSKAMVQLGSKAAAKSLASHLQIPVITGVILDNMPLDEAVHQASAIGFPLIVKASFGGGGRGMRVVTDLSQLKAALESAAREAEAFFKRGDVFVERYLSETRHIEVQVLGDGRGSALSLGDRDCSLQRNHQKVIEEAPAPLLADGTREAIHKAARCLFEAARYQGAGTAEFLVTPSGEFYFLEANTRLQVEHPVTEEIFQVDLVECQLRIAEGASLESLRLPDRSDGHAIEARLCAEIPELNFVASTGILEAFHYPPLSEHSSRVRIDTGFTAGDRISHLYDSLLAKLIVRASSREDAITGLTEALRAIQVSGIRTNRNYLLDLLHDPDFRHCRHHTRTAHARIPEEQAYAHTLFDAATSYLTAHFDSALSATSHHPRWRSLVYSPRTLHLDVDGEVVTAALRPTESGWNVATSWRSYSAERPLPISSATIAQRVSCSDASSAIILESAVCNVRRAYPRIVRPQDSVMGPLDRFLRAPLPGRVVKLTVSPGAQVSENETVIVLESMKMEHQIAIHRSGTVRAVCVAQGQTVERDAVLLELEA